MDPKTFRYMQRIERIIGTPHRVTSPIRPSKSPLLCKTNRLDRYLKFELAAKISASIIHKNYKRLTALFFNAIRNCEPQQRERIYKFIPIEKKEDAIIMKVDVNIAVRLFRTVMIQLVENRMGKCFEVLKKYEEKDESQSNKFERIQLPAFKSMAKISSKNEQQGLNRKVSEWNDAAPTSIVNQNLKIQKKNFKQFVLRSIGKTLRRAVVKRKQKGFQLIKFAAKQRKMVQIRKDCQIYEREVAKKIREIQMQEQIKMDKQERYVKEIRMWEEKLLKFSANMKSTKYDSKIMRIPEESQEYKVNNDDLIRLLKSYHHKFKANFLKLMKNGLRTKHFITKPGRQVQCYIFLHKMTNFIQRRNIASLKAIKRCVSNHKIRQQRALKLCNTLAKITNLKIDTISHSFLSEVTKKSSQFKQKSNLLNLEKNKYDYVLTKSEATKINTPRSFEIEGPTSKTNFYIFVEKMAKFIQIMGKMLFPLKQSFVAIDRYSSLVFKVEEAFLRVNYRYKELCFKKMKNYNPIKRSRGKEQSKALNNIVNILSLDVIDRYIEAFSRLKIMTRADLFKIQMRPVECTYVLETRKFIAERQEAGKRNEQTWSKLLQEIKSAK